jgi:hypothetical protein
MTRPGGLDATRALCLALDGRDMGPLVARLDDTSMLSFPGLSGLGGDYNGREAIAGLLRRMAAATGGTLHFEVWRSLLSHPGALRIEGRLSGNRDGRQFSVAMSVDATLVDQAFQNISIDCSDRQAWDALWGRARRSGRRRGFRSRL